MNIHEVFQKVLKTIAEVMKLDVVVQWSPAIQFVLVSIGTLTSFSIALHKGDVNANLPFLSETGAFSPEQCIFSMTLFIGSFIGCIFIIFRFLIIAENPSHGRIFYVSKNKLSLAIGLSSMMFLAGVAAFPMTTVFWAHLLVAGGYFATSAAYIALSTMITKDMEGPSKMFSIRLTLSVIICVFQLILLVVFPIALIRWNYYNDVIPALKTPNDKGFLLLLIASILEWSTVALIISFHMTFIFEFRSFKLLMKAEKTISDAADGDVAEVPA